MNRVNLFGIVSAKPEEIDVEQLTVKLQLEVSEDEGGYPVQIPCVARGSRARLVAKYVCAGDQLIIGGRLCSCVCTDSDGAKRAEMVVEILRMKFVPDGSGQGDAR